ncbi:MAG: SH3 domain-containing protein [Verrucomicrobia bacterium]|nr:SH3 domain-containing protein [Verrucomicrobiota bacterium]
MAYLVSVGMCAAGETFTVSASRVNVRAIPDAQGEIVGQVSQGTVLTGSGDQRDGWVGIRPPSEISVWLYGELVRDGVVAAGSVRVRSGPGIGYRPVGTLEKGTKVETLGTKGDWLRIAPPPACTVWISETFVTGGTRTARAKPPAAPAAPAKPAVAAVKLPAKPKKPTRAAVQRTTRPKRPVSSSAVHTPPMPVNPLNKPAVAVPVRRIVPVSPEPQPRYSESTRRPASALANLPRATQKLRLVDGALQGESVEVTGLVDRVNFFSWGRPSRYRLMVKEGPLAPSKTGCYVMAGAAPIAVSIGDSVTLIGKKYWIQGVKEPVVVVSELRN